MIHDVPIELATGDIMTMSDRDRSMPAARECWGPQLRRYCDTGARTSLMRTMTANSKTAPLAAATAANGA